MNFPHNGKSLAEFSTQWKNIFHGVDGGGAAAPTHNPSHHDGAAPAPSVDGVVGTPNQKGET